MFDFLLLCGWLGTTALVTLLWCRRYPGRPVFPGVLLGLVAGLAWPVTLWIAVGLWWYWGGQPPTGQPPTGQPPTGQPPTGQADPLAQARTMAEQAHEQAHRAGLPTSAAYWGAEVQRLDAGGASDHGELRRPPAIPTAVITILCVLGFVLTIGVLGALAEPAPSAPDVVAAPGAPPAPAAPAAPAAPGETVRVVRIVDGDTVELADGRTVRLLGIDAPEISNGTECWGPEATEFAQDTLSGRTLQLVTEPTPETVDRYDRTLGYLILPDGTNYSVMAAESGAVFASTHRQPVRFTAQIDAAQAQAQAAGRGVWGPPCFGTAGPIPVVEPVRAAPAPEAAPPAAPTTAAAPAAPTTAPRAEPAPTQNCAPGYSPCIPPYPPDLDCSDVNGPIIVTGSDPQPA